MPLTKKGTKVLSAMEKEYGTERGKQVFYASINAGKLKGVHRPHPETAEAHRRKHSR